MNKTTKGALGASAAAVLLMGGAGSLAYWTDASTANGGSITAGNLRIEGIANTANGGSFCEKWTYAEGAAKATQPVVLFVPGDKVTTKCTFKVTATGDNLSALVAAPTTLATTGTPAGTSLKIDTAVSYTLTKGTATKSLVPGAANTSTITSADDASTLTATFVATIPFGTDEAGVSGGVAGAKVNVNDTKSIKTALQDLTVSLTQVNPNA